MRYLSGFGAGNLTHPVHVSAGFLCILLGQNPKFCCFIFSSSGIQHRASWFDPPCWFPESQLCSWRNPGFWLAKISTNFSWVTPWYCNILRLNDPFIPNGLDNLQFFPGTARHVKDPTSALQVSRARNAAPNDRPQGQEEIDLIKRGRKKLMAMGHLWIDSRENQQANWIFSSKCKVLPLIWENNPWEQCYHVLRII